MEINSIQNLLQQVSEKRKHYDKIAEATGENFNIFKILKVETKEVRLHSAFLAELLNPNGNHGQKDAFLKLFINQLDIKEFITDHAQVEVEKHTGPINEDCTEGGFIDIVITSVTRQKIIIENKIHAPDQKNQLIRYKNHDQNAHLYYLSLDKKTPTDWSAKGLLLGKDFKTLSYSSEIINWLERCKKESVNHPLLRETITQYINLIKTLTNQSINNIMSEDIKKVIFQNYDSYQSAEQICRELQGLGSKIEQSLWGKLNSKWERKTITCSNLPQGYKIIFDTGDDGGLHYGFWLENNGIEVKKPDECLNNLIVLLKTIDNNFKDWNGWIGWKNPNTELNFRAIPLSKAVFDLMDETKLDIYINDLIVEMDNYIKQFQAKIEVLSFANEEQEKIENK